MKYQKCLYCDKPIDRYSLYHLFIEEDLLCLECRKQLALKPRRFMLEDMECEYLYDYDSLFKSILLQYKECYDEALKDVFLYKIDTYLRFKYLGHKVIYVPSSGEKIRKRGFDHIREIYGPLGFKEAKGLMMRKDLIQEGKNIEERRAMIGNYYYEGEDLDKVLVLDDVCASGSSLLAVKKALKGRYKVIRSLVLAKS